MPSISIVVPIYNTSPYLAKCLDSILEQTLSDMEIILVDDGSTDDSGSICDQYAKKDSRVRVVHKSNGGLVSSRKTGIQIATGQYIGFVDSDDWIEAEMYETLYSLAQQYDADIVTSGYIREGNYSSYDLDFVDEGVYRGEKRQWLVDHAIFDLRKEDLGIRGSLCTKIFRRSLIAEAERYIPDKMTMSEDKMAMLTAMLNAQTIYILHKAFYHYILYPSSMSNYGKSDYLLKVDLVYQYLLFLQKKYHFSTYLRASEEIYIVQLLIKGINTRLGFANRNMLWLDPSWLDVIPSGARVLLVGVGEVLRVYRQQVECSDHVSLLEMLDYHNPDWCEQAKKLDFAPATDFVVLATKDKKLASTMRDKLVSMGFPNTHILWFEQKEIFWKYTRALGLSGEHANELREDRGTGHE